MCCGIKVNVNGYNTMHFIFMYVLGHAISRFNIQFKLKQYYWLFIYVITSILLPFVCMPFPDKVFRYNNPILILSAISLFCFIIRFNFKNRIINFIASCVFPVYILQEGIMGQRIYKYQGLFYEQYGSNILMVLSLIFLFSLSFFVLAMIIEPFRKRIMRPLVDSIAVYIKKWNLDVFVEDRG